jgi:integrase
LSETNRSWLLRYERHGRERWHGLGPVHTWSLKEARERARKARQQLGEGIDPIEAKRAARAAQALAEARALTFEAAATQYFDQYEKKWRNQKHRNQFLSTLRQYVFPKIGRLSVSDIDTGLVLKCVEPIWPDKTETANRVRGRIESVLDWATVRGYRVGDNPARWRGHLAEVLPAPGKIQKTNHHAALPYVELPAFMGELREREGIAARALEFTILTAARSGEVMSARWSEIDLKGKVWVLPPERMKAGREHKVPLSDTALALLRSLPREDGNEHVFIGTKTSGGLSHMAMNTTLRRMKRADITVHGMRSTFMDWAHERTAFPKPVIDMALAHTIGDQVEAAYRRGDLFDKRKRLMAEWARYCESKPVEAGGEVVALQRMG